MNFGTSFIASTSSICLDLQTFVRRAISSCLSCDTNTQLNVQLIQCFFSERRADTWIVLWDISCESIVSWLAFGKDIMSRYIYSRQQSRDSDRSRSHC
jgi:hypothetical protein